MRAVAPGIGDRGQVEDLFFGYIAAILPSYFFKLKGNQRPIRVPNAYAVLMGMNRLATELPLRIDRGRIRRADWPTRTGFEALLTRLFWTQNAKPTKTLRAFEELGFVKTQARFSITKKGVGLLVQHAKAAFRFFTNIDPATMDRTESDWIQLNERIFQAFFLGQYGQVWSPLRDSVNVAIRTKRKGVYETDPLSTNTNYWIVFNVVAVLREVDSLVLGRIISQYKLDPLASSNRSISAAEKILLDAGVLTSTVTRESQTYRVSGRYLSRVNLMLEGLQNGLSALSDACHEFANED